MEISNPYISVELETQVEKYFQEVIELPILITELIDHILFVEVLLLSDIVHEFVVFLTDLLTHNEDVECEE